jgi:hypothetical protein
MSVAEPCIFHVAWMVANAVATGIMSSFPRLRSGDEKMNLERMNYFVADYLAQYEDAGEWTKAEEMGENIRLQIHSLINSGIAEKELWGEVNGEDEVK